MDPPETLSTVAEIALGLAGFTGLLVVLGRQPGRFSPSEAFRLLVLLVASSCCRSCPASEIRRRT